MRSSFLPTLSTDTIFWKENERSIPSGGYACLAFLLTQTPHKVVVTTNFDRLTEDAVTLYAHEFSLVVGHVAMAHYITSDVARPTVVKIHHDLYLTQKVKMPIFSNWMNGGKRRFPRFFEISPDFHRICWQ